MLLLAGAGIAVSLAAALLLAMDLGPVAVRTDAGRSGDGLRGFGVALVLAAASVITFPAVVAAWSRRGGFGQGLLVAAVTCLGGLMAALFGADLTLAGSLGVQLAGFGMAVLAAAAPAVVLVWALCSAPRPGGGEVRGSLGLVLAGVALLVVMLGAWVIGII